MSVIEKPDAELVAKFGVTPGVARHGAMALRWDDSVDMGFRDKSSGDVDIGYIGTLSGHFCVFNRWTEIDSFFEGRFMESISPGACKKTFEENRAGIRCVLQHGRDPQFGMKPLGPIRELEEDDVGGRYEVPMLDTSLNRDLLPALKEPSGSLYGASFRFQVLREEVTAQPPRSDYNPEGIEERKITEMKIREFGPVTFPAYADATAGARSLNDWWVDPDVHRFHEEHPDDFARRQTPVVDAGSHELLAKFLGNPRNQRLLEAARSADPDFDAECRRAEELLGSATVAVESAGGGPTAPQLVAATNARRQEQLRRATRAPALEAKYLSREPLGDRRAAQGRPQPASDPLKWRHGIRAAQTITSPRRDRRL